MNYLTNSKTMNIGRSGDPGGSVKSAARAFLNNCTIPPAVHDCSEKCGPLIEESLHHGKESVGHCGQCSYAVHHIGLAGTLPMLIYHSQCQCDLGAKL